ncbi:MAG TPA: phenylalanine--tRNA ligase subunit beta [Phycisphaerales bacterium]|nr:phenylalanine--tRNA ligase subunit beta [Phycisphaerales bacterium]
MKVSLDWLKDYVEVDRPGDALAAMLSDLGFPCESVERVGDDTVIDLEVTSNRGDCLGHIGVAREIAAVTGRSLRLPETAYPRLEQHTSELAAVEIAEPELCGRYTARIIKGVKVGPSPDWVVRRLEAVGLRSVNNVVDATNYAMMETGQPPHAFDYAKIADGKIIVRRGRAGERITSIDGTQCELNERMLAIADPSGPVAIAGVMGGLHTEVSDATTDILLEDAYFDPVSVRSTSRALALPSEASYRFERIVDIEQVDWASRRTCRLIVEWAGGRVAKGVVDVYPRRWAPKELRLRLARLNALLGIDVPGGDVLRILGALQFEPRLEGDVVVCRVPSWRCDVYREVDLIEEVIRVYGYGKVPTRRKIEIEVVPVDARQKLVSTVGAHLNSCGFYETVNVTFVDEKAAAVFGEPGRGTLAVRDQARRQGSILRQSLIGSLLGVLRTNVNAKNLPCRVYEIADTFVPVGGGCLIRGRDALDTGSAGHGHPARAAGLPIERPKLGLVCDGDLRALRGAVESVVSVLNRDAEVVFKPAQLSWAEHGARIEVNGVEIGLAGVVSQEVAASFDIKDLSPVAAEVYFDDLAKLAGGPIAVRPIPRFPAIERDLSIVVDETVAWSAIAEAVRAGAPDELERLDFVTIYHGKGIPSGRKCVTLTLRFRDADGTLTHEQVDRMQNRILDGLKAAVGARLRAM